MVLLAPATMTAAETQEELLRKHLEEQKIEYLFRSEGFNPSPRNPVCTSRRCTEMGSAFIAFGIVVFVGFFYAAVVSKLLPPYENRFLSAIQNDRYYCLLVPLTLPVIIVAVYLHWLSMKMFKHA